MKIALVKPLLKKSGLDKESLKNYRPVSNLSFVSKVLERLVVRRTEAHLTENNLREVYQSAYVRNHSTETALVRVHNDICRMVDVHGAAMVLLLDLSAAFDTIDHEMLLARLSSWFGIKGKVLSWMRLYLIDRSQFCQCAWCNIIKKSNPVWCAPRFSSGATPFYSVYMYSSLSKGYIILWLELSSLRR